MSFFVYIPKNNLFKNIEARIQKPLAKFKNAYKNNPNINDKDFNAESIMHNNIVTEVEIKKSSIFYPNRERLLKDQNSEFLFWDILLSKSYSTFEFYINDSKNCLNFSKGHCKNASMVLAFEEEKPNIYYDLETQSFHYGVLEKHPDDKSIHINGKDLLIDDLPNTGLKITLAQQKIKMKDKVLQSEIEKFQNEFKLQFLLIENTNKSVIFGKQQIDTLQNKYGRTYYWIKMPPKLKQFSTVTGSTKGGGKETIIINEEEE